MPRGGPISPPLPHHSPPNGRRSVDGALWKCSGDRCSAPAQGGRPVFVCAKVAGKFGAVASFATPAGALSEAEVSRCNALK